MVELAPPKRLRVVMSSKNNKNHKFIVSQTVFEVNTKYAPISPLGKGSYGVVCSSVNTDTNEKVAIKKINNVFENEVEAVKTLREIMILRHVRHENVIGLKDVMITSSKANFKDVYLVYELMDTDLDKIITSPQPLSDDHCKFFLFQLLRGLKHLHSANILHRDLKPANLLVNANCDLKICDFGLSRTSKGEVGEFLTEYVVTRWYRAPELLVCSDSYGMSVDVWSVGCIFAELLGRGPLFPGANALDQLQRIIEVLGKPCESDLEFVENPKAVKYIRSLPYTSGVHFAELYPNADRLGLDLLQKMLVFDPDKRISVSEALIHPYLLDLYECDMDPPAPKPLDIDVDSNVGVRELRELMWREMLCYHPG